MSICQDPVWRCFHLALPRPPACICVNGLLLAQSPHSIKWLKGAPGIEGASGSPLKGNNVDVIAFGV